MDVTIRIPDAVARRLSAAGGDISRRTLEALALEGYRDQTLTLYEVSEMLGLSRVQTADFFSYENSRGWGCKKRRTGETSLKLGRRPSRCLSISCKSPPPAASYRRFPGGLHA